MTTQKYVTVREVAELLSASQKTVYQWAELRQIPCYKINGCLRFRLEEVLEYIETCKIKPHSGMTDPGFKKTRSGRNGRA